MKNLLPLLFTAIVFFLSGCEKTDQQRFYNEGINITPVPLELNQKEGNFNLSKKTVFVTNDEDAQKVASFFISKMNQSTGYSLKVAQEKPATNYIELSLKDNLPVNNEGYILDVSPDGIEIQASTPQGLFYGMQTVMQLLPAEIVSPKPVKNIAWNIPAVNIKDEPRFEYRGMHLDVCRHFLPVEAVKKHIDIISLFKLNKLHWHLTEDQLWTIEIKKYPDLIKGSTRIEGDGSTYGGFYTQEDIKEVVAYAAERFVEIIPEIEMPGHAKAVLVAYPELSCTGGPFDNPRITWGVEDDVFCAGNEDVFTFLEDVLREVAELFPSQYIHIGGDECPKIRWKNCPKCQKRIDELGLRSIEKRTDAFGKLHSPEEALQSYFITRIDKFVTEELGKTIIGWDEILEGGLAPSAIVMSWRGESGGIAAAQLGHRAIMTPNSAGFYLDHYQGAPEVELAAIGGYSILEKVYSYNPIPEKLTEDQHKYIWGTQGNLWSEYMLNPEHVEYMAYPRVVAIAEVAWSQPGRKDWDDFQRRLVNTMVRLDLLNVNYHIPLPEGALVDILEFTEDSVEIPFTNTRNYKMVYTLDGKEPNAKSTEYTEPLKIDETTTIKIATLLPHGKLSKTITLEVKKQELRPAATVEGDQPGVLVKIADGLFVTDEQIAAAPFGEQVTAKQFGRSAVINQNGDSIAVIRFDMNKPSVAVYEGYVELLEDGVYGFATDMDELWINGELIIKNGQECASRHLRHKTTRALAKGKHEYKLVFNNMIKHGWPTGWNHIAILVKAPGEEKYVRLTPDRYTYVKK